LNLFDEHNISVIALDQSDLGTLCISRNSSRKSLKTHIIWGIIGFLKFSRLYNTNTRKLIPIESSVQTGVLLEKMKVSGIEKADQIPSAHIWDLLAANFYQVRPSRSLSNTPPLESLVLLMDMVYLPITLVKSGIQAIRLGLMNFADWLKLLAKTKPFLLSSRDRLPAFAFYREELWFVPWKRK
jgi:hypothetical protein